MDTQNNILPFKSGEVINVLQTAPDILTRNEASVSACTNAGQALLDTIEGVGGICTDEIDTAVQEYIEKSKKTVENLNNRRKPITQMLSAISKRFTSLESIIDPKSSGTIPFKLQQERNKYAAKKLEEQKRREEEARRVQMLENEKAQYRADISLLLDTSYISYVNRHIGYLNSLYNRSTLDSYNDVCRQIKEANTSFVWADFVKNVTDNIQAFYMTAEIRQSIKNEISMAKKKEFTDRYSFEVEELKQSLIDRLPSLRKQLEEQEELRRTNAVEADRIEEERRQREAEEKRKQDDERRRLESEAKAKSEAAKSVAEVQSAFNFQADAMQSYTPKVKVKKKIQITNAQGFMQVYQMWFMREGINLSMAELEKIHKKMISYCEKVANGDDEQIKSAYVKYIDDVTAK